MGAMLFSLALTACNKKHDSKPQMITGSYDFMIGKNVAGNFKSGSFNFCVGDGACPTITTQSCQVDVREIADPALQVQIATHITPKTLNDLQNVIDADNKICGPNPDRTVDNLLKAAHIRQ